MLQSKDTETLVNGHIVQIRENVRQSRDERKFADQYIVSYRGLNDKAEYRKAFYVKRGETFVPPFSGTHKVLNDMLYTNVDKYFPH